MSRGQTLAATLAGRRSRPKRDSQQADDPSLYHRLCGWLGRLPILVLTTVPAWFNGGASLAEQAWIGPLLFVGFAAWLLQLLGSPRSREASRLPLAVVPVLLGVLLGGAQRIPLPPDVAVRFAPRQHELTEQLAAPAGMAHATQTPATRVGVDGYGCEHQIAILLYGLAALLLGARFFTTDAHARVLLIVVSLNGAALSILGILQRYGWDGGLFAVESVYQGQPFATYVNRNNAAGYLLLCFAAALGLLVWLFLTTPPGARPRLIVSREIPIWRRVGQRLAYFLSQLTFPRVVSIALVGIIAVGVFASLSRGGITAFFAAMMFTAVAFGFRRHTQDSAFAMTAVAVAAVVGLAIWLSFGESLSRRFASLQTGSAATDQLRFKNWAETWPAVGDFGALGSGLDSYHVVHRLYRQDLETSLFQHAENVFFQTLVETGWLGLGLLVVAAGLMIWSSIFVSNRGNSPRTIAIGATSLFAVAASCVASFFDFGIYLPANLLLLAVLSGMTAHHGHALAQRLKEYHPLRHNLPPLASIPLMLVVAAALIPASLRMRDWTRQQAACGDTLFRDHYLAWPLDRTNAHIARLQPLFEAAPTYWGGLRLGELYLHRFRLTRLAELQAHLPLAADRLWPSTSLMSFREQIYLDERIGSRRRLQRLLDQPAVEENLLPAWNVLMQARNLLPLHSKIQFLLAQLQPVLGDLHDRTLCDRTLATAPTNSDFGFAVGAMHLQAGRVDDACRIWRRCLELDGYGTYRRVIDWVYATQTGQWRIPPERVARDILPDDPSLIVRFVHQHLNQLEHEALRRELVLRADDLLMNQPAEANADWVWLSARVKRDLGDREAAIRQYNWLKQLQPENMIARYELARVLTDKGDYPEAFAEVSWLLKHDPRETSRYRPLFDSLSQRLKKD